MFSNLPPMFFGSHPPNQAQTKRRQASPMMDKGMLMCSCSTASHRIAAQLEFKRKEGHRLGGHCYLVAIRLEAIAVVSLQGIF